MTSYTVQLPGVGAVPVDLTESGEGHPVLLLHGGGGPQSVQPWGERLATERDARVLTDTHPGFNGTPRPEALTTVAGLAALYVGLLEELDLTDVTVVGNSIGGWIAAEMATLAPPRVRGYVLVDAMGLELPDHPVADFFSLTPAGLAERSYHDPARFGLDPTTMSPEALAVMAGNRETIAVYATTMVDPSLEGRLAEVAAPFDVFWGEDDRITEPENGQALAAAVPGGRFHLLRETGHMPQIETPDLLIESVWSVVE